MIIPADNVPYDSVNDVQSEHEADNESQDAEETHYCEVWLLSCTRFDRMADIRDFSCSSYLFNILVAELCQFSFILYIRVHHQQGFLESVLLSNKHL